MNGVIMPWSQLFLIHLLLALPLASQDYIQEWEGKNSNRKLIRDWVNESDCLNANFDSDYLNKVFTPCIDRKEVSVIFEIGSRDAIDAIGLAEFYKAPVYAFECYPDAIEVAKYNIGNNPNVHLIELAAWNENTSLTFHPVVAGGEECLPGASSIFQIDPEGPFKSSLKQDKIEVQATRLDDWMDKNRINQIDFLCIDVQGASLQVLQGLGSKINNVKYIIAEVETEKYYIGQSLSDEVVKYLESCNFVPMRKTDLAQWGFPGVWNFLFIKKDYVKTESNF
jgi:FkbM family methyltransferase